MQPSRKKFNKAHQGTKSRSALTAIHGINKSIKPEHSGKSNSATLVG
jgi:hypothetical protein